MQKRHHRFDYPDMLVYERMYCEQLQIYMQPTNRCLHVCWYWPVMYFGELLNAPPPQAQANHTCCELMFRVEGDSASLCEREGLACLTRAVWISLVTACMLGSQPTRFGRACPKHPACVAWRSFRSDLLSSTSVEGRTPELQLQMYNYNQSQ